MPTSVRFDHEIEERLDHLAKITGRTKSYYIREAVLEKLEDLEDIYVAEKRLEDTFGKRWSLEEMERDIGLED